MSVRRPSRAVRAAVLASLLGVALAGCSGSGASSGGAASQAPEAVAAPGVADNGTASVAGGGTATGGKTSYDAGSGLGTVTIGRDVIVRADLAVRVDDVTASTARVASVAASHRAVIASQSTSDGAVPLPVPASSDGTATSDYCAKTGCPSGYATSVTTLRVANSEVDALLRDLRALGTVTSSSRTSDDVTAQVADVTSRVESARASLARVRLLMDRASTLGEVVTLEAELGKRQADLESLEAQQRALADQTALATVTVTLTSEAAPVAAEADTGFLAGLKAGWSAFTTALVAGLTVVGAVLPFLIVLVPLGLLAWWLVRRSGRRTPPPVEEV
ncbi:MAG TPA: DUF4349 domain-containing protein [Candidatus Nanopelagicales bacterium]|nr:DUF4349 domain-containing protein [Candidatus Nanopelagicales bacterium]